jgi:hypothetical protein
VRQTDYRTREVSLPKIEREETCVPRKARWLGYRIALKLRRAAVIVTNGWPPQKNGAASFRRMLGANRTSMPHNLSAFAVLDLKPIWTAKPHQAKESFAHGFDFQARDTHAICSPA